MHHDEPARNYPLDRLGAFAGRVDRASRPARRARGRMIFEWALDRRYLLWHSTIPAPQVPDSLAIIAADFALLPPRVGALTGMVDEGGAGRSSHQGHWWESWAGGCHDAGGCGAWCW